MDESPPYQFKPHERPTLPGSPANPDHPTRRRLFYLLIGALIGVTGGLGNALVAVNLSFAQGTLGLDSDESVLLTAAYLMTNTTANLLMVKYRQQFGLQSFVRYMLAIYAAATVLHLFVHDFSSSVMVRAASGFSASALSTLTILYLMQGLPAARRLAGVMIGISIPQLATPLARALSPHLLVSGDWHMVYWFELGLVLATLAAVMALPLPPSERSEVFERGDFLTFALLAPGLWLLIAVLSEGRIQWWTERAWMGWASAASLVLVTTALMFEHRRANPLINTRWLGTREMARLMLVAAAVRVLLSEQAFGSVGLLTVLGMLNDQMVTLNLIIVAASVAGMLVAVITFNPADVTRPIAIAVLIIAIGAFLDADATNLTRPSSFYLSQALIGFASLLFMAQAMVIGISRTLLAGPRHLVSFVVLFGLSQSIGGLIGSALLGTFQTVREKFHSHELVQSIVMTDPIVAARVRAGSGAVGGVIGDPALRGAEGAALLAQQVAREANILAYNDVFLLVGILSLLVLLWGLLIRRGIRLRGEDSPIILLQRRLQAASGGAAKT
ncbi:MFS transporter [Novosphingobium album (ex Liu et al. 2023)]|uniref:MFS transporter n=1 Tax=Novosphingobium album (ex Liu et al. 2023) TaxID=3031130 RepID=A0ABT5WLG5_9SPHN|nr:MFS transporter [Novosphingobium album (ex Liu et al. 2023)]MDE8650889.1 MFS transporter [Novosphingobium album (ex Liu et al. 2023)]